MMSTSCSGYPRSIKARWTKLIAGASLSTGARNSERPVSPGSRGHVESRRIARPLRGYRLIPAGNVVSFERGEPPGVVHDEDMARAADVEHRHALGLHRRLELHPQYFDRRTRAVPHA